MSAIRVLVVAASLSLFASCASSPLPPRLTAAEEARLAELPLPHTVGVVPYKYPVYSERLTDALEAAGVFQRVDAIAAFQRPPDLVAVVEDSIHGSAVIPAATFASAGVVPTVVEEDHGFIFSLAPASQRGRKTLVDASYSGTTTLGWVGLAINALPGHTGSEPRESERFQRMLAYRTLMALRPD